MWHVSETRIGCTQTIGTFPFTHTTCLHSTDTTDAHTSAISYLRAMLRAGHPTARD